MGKFFKVATVAGLFGLAVLHADDFASVATKVFNLFPESIALSKPTTGTVTKK